MSKTPPFKCPSCNKELDGMYKNFFEDNYQGVYERGYRHGFNEGEIEGKAEVHEEWRIESEEINKKLMSLNLKLQEMIDQRKELLQDE